MQESVTHSRLRMFGLGLGWGVCRDGVELVDRGPTEPAVKKLPGGGYATLLRPLNGKWFQPRSKRYSFVEYDLTDLSAPVVVQYANATTDEKLAAFFTQRGLISLVDGDVDRGSALQSRRSLVELLKKAGGGDDAEAVIAVSRAMSSVTKLSPYFKRSGDKGKPQLNLQPTSLYQYMVMETAMVALYGARLRSCAHCKKQFLFGPLTGRRSHVKYCSDRCRVAAMRARSL